MAANTVTRGLGPGPLLYGACNLLEVFVAARLREALRRSALALDDGTTLLLSMSCGTALHAPGMRFEDIVYAADMALDRAKRAGRPDLARTA